MLKYSKVLDLRQVAQISGSIESEIGMNTGENEIPLRMRKHKIRTKTQMLENLIYPLFTKYLLTSEVCGIF